MRKKSIGRWGLVALCAGLLLAATATAQINDPKSADVAQTARTANPGQLSSASSAQAVVNEKEASLPEVKPPEGLSEKELKLMEEFQGKELPDLEESAFSLLPVEVGYEDDLRGPCLGDKDINGAGTLSFTYMLNTGWHDRRTTSIYLASEFGCDGGPINGIRYYVSTVPGMMFTNLTIRLKHTTATVYVSPYCMSNTDWTVCYQADTTISTTGWYTFTFATPFEYNGVDNVEVDVCFNNTAYTGGGAIWAFSAGTGVYRTMYAYTDSGYGDPLVWTCGTGNPTIYGLINVPRGQFIFPPPTFGACCVDFECVATNTHPECDALGGTWYGGQDCATFYCPPWNDNCTAVTPVTLTPGTPVTFTGNNLGATNDCGSFPGGQVWHAITLPAAESFFDVWLDYCTTNNGGFPFGNAWLNWATGCPCTGITTAGTFDTTTCGDGNITIKWSGLASGTYYYPVLLDAANHAAGDYTLHVVCMPAYCASSATSTADETLKTVQLGTIDNTTTDCDKYNDFTYLSTDVIAGSTYPFNIVIGDCEGTSCYTKWLKIYVDWNQDYDFDDAGEQAYTSGVAFPNTPCPDYPVSGNITVPATATVGCTRMRVIVRETSEPTPCGTYTWGATEDYTVCILPPGEQGACCFGVDCTPDMYQIDCEQQGGRYKGNGTTCEPLNPCFGACCFLDGSCLETLDLAECTGLGGNYSGDGTTCTPNLCPQPGNNCAVPKLITLLPGGTLVDTDTTCGRVNDYADTCLGSYDGGEDIIYELTLPYDMCVKISVDGVLTWVGVAIDTVCPPGAACLAYATSSAGDPVISDLFLTAGVYYIMIDTYPSPTCTGFTMTVRDCACDVPCPPEGILEPEPCGEDTDGGCNMAVPTFAPIACGDVVCGTMWASTSLRDTDWYQLTTTDWNYFTWTAEAEVPVLIFIIRGAGPDDCSSYAILGSATAQECTPVSLTTDCLSPGTYWFWVGPSAFQDSPCPKDYVVSLECATCPPQYCTAGSSYVNCDEYISRVQVGTIDNVTACSQPGGYGDYTALSTDLPYTVGVPIIVTNGHPYSSDQCKVWIDWNQDLDFYDDGEGITMSGSPGNGPYTANITAPLDALSGPTRMRVRITYTGALDPCGITTYGEVEDYTVNIVEVPGACCWGDGTCTMALPSECTGYYGGPFSQCAGEDCQPNGVDDFCDIASGYSEDCDSNGIPDECQPFEDCDGNGIADFCDIAQCDGSPWCSDCNENGVLDVCDIGNGTSQDCQGNGIPDECDVATGGPGVLYLYDDGTHENSIGLTSGGYVAWMVHFVVQQGGSTIGKVHIAYGMVTDGTPLTIYVWSDPNQDGNPTDGQVAAQAAAVVANSDLDVFNEVDVPDVNIGPAGTHFFAGAIIQHLAGEYPCSLDETSSAGESWIAGDSSVPVDPNNMGAASLPPLVIDTYFPGNWLVRAESVGGGDCNQNGIPDACDVPPICQGPDCSQDCNGDLVPDECQLEGNDCNANGRPDDCDITGGTSLDCNGNGIPDECELEGNDCNGNLVPDECDIASGVSQDCQPNGIPDECDIAAGSCDCQGDGIPDECQLFTARTLIWDNGPLATGPGCTGEISVLQDTLGLGTYGWGAQQSASNRIADDFTLDVGCQIDTITVYTYQTGATPPTITSVVMQIWNGPPNAGGAVVWGDLTTNRLVSCTPAYIFRTLPTIDCTRHIQTVVAAVNVQLPAGTYWVDYSFAGSGTSGPWAPPVTILGLTGKPGANAIQWDNSVPGWVAVVDATYPQDFPFLVEGTCGAPPNDCNENGIPDECDIGVQWGGFCTGQGGCWPTDCESDWNSNGIPDSCELGGDIDNDGDVDMDDYWAFVDAFGTCVGNIKYNPAADMDGDGCITLVDYRAWRMFYKMANGEDFVPPKPKPMPMPAPTKAPKPGVGL